MSMTAGRSVAVRAMELWEIITRFSVPSSGLDRDTNYTRVDSHGCRGTIRNFTGNGIAL
jgi:hypothetical protein